MKLFVWDFHGVLEKGNEYAVLEISNKAPEELGFHQRLSIDDCHKLYGLRWYEFFEYLLPNEPHETHIHLQSTSLSISKRMPEIVTKHIRLNDFAGEVLDRIHQVHSQILISNTQPTHLEFFMNTVGISRYFKQKAFAADNHRKDLIKTKIDILKEYLNKCDEPYDSVIIIGDSPNDMEMGKISKTKTYLYSRPDRAFRLCESNYRINDLRDILREI